MKNRLAAGNGVDFTLAVRRKTALDKNGRNESLGL